LLIGYIEGFQAADLNLIGERAFAKSEGEKRDLNGNNDFRIIGSYTKVLEQLFKDNDLRSRLRLKHRVSQINWEKSKIEIECLLPSGRKTRVYAKQVVLAVPLGVLKSSHPKSKIEFTPPMPRLSKSLEQVHMGHAQRLIFVFKDRFWENLSEEKPVCFLRAGQEFYFPTWWAYAPLRTPCLVAWQGGPRAQEMALWSEEKCVDVALSTLSKLTKRTKTFLRDHLVSVHHHNWSKDPYSLGAYSYSGIDAGKKHPGIPACFENILWLTGEAFAPADGQGTVHGALEHGAEIAKKIAKRLR
jgi:monoamine oxidase